MNFNDGNVLRTYTRPNPLKCTPGSLPKLFNNHRYQEGTYLPKVYYKTKVALVHHITSQTWYTYGKIAEGNTHGP